MSKTDPQGSSKLISGYLTAMRAKFLRIRQQILDHAPAMLVANPAVTFNAGQFDFPIDATKGPAFMAWLRQMIEAELFETESGDFDETSLWANQFIRLAHSTAGSRAKAKISGPTSILGGEDILVGISAFGPSSAGVSQKSLAMLYMRNFELLKDVSADMASQISTILAEGYVGGLSSLSIARRMDDAIASIGAIRAERIARTEIVRAYAEGSLDMFEAYGIPGVTAKVEFMTMGDNLVCPRCMVLNEKVFTVAEARGKIPVHPNCRCDWLPVIRTMQ